MFLSLELACRRDADFPAARRPAASWLPLRSQLVLPIIPGYGIPIECISRIPYVAV